MAAFLQNYVDSEFLLHTQETHCICNILVQSGCKGLLQLHISVCSQGVRPVSEHDKAVVHLACVPVGVTDLPAELSRCFLLIRELDQKSIALQAEIGDRCGKHVSEHAAEHEVLPLACSDCYLSFCYNALG